MMWHNGYGMGWQMWIVVGLSFLTFWAFIVVLVRLVLTDRRPAQPAPPTPLAELDGRLARGEVTPEDYARIRRLLTEGH